jgi:hypothetical protein
MQVRTIGLVFKLVITKCDTNWISLWTGLKTKCPSENNPIFQINEQRKTSFRKHTINMTQLSYIWIFKHQIGNKIGWDL